MGTSTSSSLVLLLVTAHLMLLSAASTQANPVVYNQPPVFPNTFNGWTSDRDLTEGFRTWDNFAVSQSTLIDGLSWQGFYWDFLTPGNNPVAPETVSWEVSFWSDAANQPLAPLQVQLLPVVNVQRTSAGLTVFNGDTVPVFNFHVALNSFLAHAGTTYWLSILSNSPTFNPIWSWMEGSGGDDITIQDELPGAVRLVRPEDRTFSLEGQTVPEPGTLSLLLLGISCLLGYWWLWRERLVSLT